ncbi:glycoside hydrolase [Ceraceosorus guamensis]|uniref:Glycoside hydrolase n=1 Tax=Ceraceosorus guamensis TaxID=1522189 RepID=A0A316VN51_9BASI|nr:glycoside hydrolase [Ceraceosorus guamensis]PWN38740.1 glycoside hydrolase [Ceraceosorus guamensis]
MRLLPRDTNIYSLASGLSLAIANYKPVPQLPTNGTTAAAALTAQLGGASLAELGGAGRSFQVQTGAGSGAAGGSGDARPVEEWGEPSVLYVAQRNASTANSFASSGPKIGPGNCPIQSAYTPKGGEDALPPPVFAPFDPVKANVMRYRQQNAVNMGAWFVLEGWMQSNLFSCSTGGKQAEYDVLDGFGQSAAGVRNATAYMERHWDTWITEDDFAKLAAQGINSIRLPIGYWSVGPYFTRNSPFLAYQDVYARSWRYVARAINWAAKYDMGVLVDLHGAYGSQNGQPHSGLSDGNIEFYNDYNMGLTTDLLVWLAKEISDVTNVIGIQLLNEPQDRSNLWPWYRKAMDAMRAASPEAKTVPLYFHNAFNLDKGSQFTATRKDFVVQDHHAYYVYTSSDQSTTAKGHTKALNGGITTWFNKNSDISRRNLIVGEWSCALAPSSLAKSSTPQQDQTAFCEAQRKLYTDATAGWAFWSYKLEGCSNNGGWCFQQAAKQYLPSTFDLWNSANVTKNVYAAIGSAAGKKDANKKVADLLATISAIQLPSASSLNLKKIVSGGGGDADDESTPDVLSAKTSASASATAPSSETARVGMVVHKTRNVNGGGSIAARAGAMVRSQLSSRQAAAASTPSDQTLASRAGFSDGFKTARYFASNANLSKLGFAQQYMEDSWSARLALGKLKSGNAASYKKQFKAGLAAAEGAILKAVQAAK